MKRYSQAIRDEIASLYATGKTMREVAQVLNISRFTVSDELRRRGVIITTAQNKLHDEAVQLYLAGATIQDIALQLDSSNGTIGRIIAAAQVGRPKLGRPNPANAIARRKSVVVDGLKFCTGCEGWKPPEQFPPSKNSLDGRRPQCNVCHNKASTDWRCKSPAGKAYVARKNKERNLAMKQATPRWADLDQIDIVYLEARRITRATKEAHSVDHIIPLIGTVSDELGERPVSGLHIAWNLRVLPRDENARKSNRVRY